MTYPLPAWSDNPATSSPLDAANLTLFNDAIEDLDTRSTALSDGLAGVVSLALATATGDLLVGQDPGVVGTLGVGTDGQVLTADSSQLLGVKWASPAPGGVATVTATNSTIVVSGSSSNPTIGIGAVPESSVTNLSTDLTARITKATVTTKGDLLVASGSATPVRLGVGSNTQVLTADSTQTTGVKWATPSASGVVTIAAGDSSIAVDSTDPANPTITVDQANLVLTESQITSLTTDLAAKIPKSTVTTKGDLLAGTASATVARLGVGSNGQGLLADSAQTPGVKWGTVVTTVTAADGTISVAGTGAAPTVAVGTIAESQVTGLTTDLAAKEVAANKGSASGYASLDGSTKVPIAQLPTGSSSSTVTIGNDSRLSDARTPTGHHTTHSTGGTDAIAPADIGAEASANKAAASGYASLDGSTKVPIAQLPTGSSSSTVTIGNDSRLSDARTPTAHHTTHSTGGGDAIAPGDIGALALSTATTKGDLLAATASATIARVGVGSNGQGLLADSTQTPGIKWGTVVTSVAAADGTISVAGTGAAPTFAVGSIAESQVTNLTTDLSGKVATSRQVIAGSGLSGGGALTSDVTLTAARVTSPANTVSYSATLALDPTLGNNQNITATGALSLSISTTGAIDGQMIMVSVKATGAQTVTLTSTNIPAGLSSTLNITSGKVGLLGFRYVGLASVWMLMSETQTV